MNEYGDRLRPNVRARNSHELLEACAAYDTWQPQWRLGYGPLKIAADVEIVGQEGVDLIFESSPRTFEYKIPGDAAVRAAAEYSDEPGQWSEDRGVWTGSSSTVDRPQTVS